jgi:hypothetical protein
MTRSPISPLVFAGVMILVLIVVLVAARAWGRWRVGRWCRQQDYELLEFRGAWFFEGPRAWLRSENQDAYHIQVRDRRGQTRSGYVVFGSYWWPWSRKVRVEWDNIESAGDRDLPDV